MPQVNPLTRELLVKLVYYGPGLGGKTTSLQRIHGASPPETRGQIVSLATPVDRTLYFDFLPLRVGPVRDHHVRLQLFTVPGQVYFNATRKLVLTGADGVVFVADSQSERQDANLESLENLASNLEEQGRALEGVPLVLQYNKRDLSNVLAIEELDESLNAFGAPAFPTCAATGEGVVDTLDALVQRTLEDLEARQAFGAEPAERPSQPDFDRAEPGLEQRIGRVSETAWQSTVERAVRDGSSEVPADAPRPAWEVETPSTVEPASAAAPGEALRARGTSAAMPDGAGPSWTPLFPDDVAEIVAIERDMAAGRMADVLAGCDALANKILSRVAVQAGLPAEPGVAVSLLGVGGERWLAFRRLLRRVREGGPVDRRDALEAFGLVIEMRLRDERSRA